MEAGEGSDISRHCFWDSQIGIGAGEKAVQMHKICYKTMWEKLF